MFSVVIPIYNKENQIVDCINSLKQQTFNDFEVIIVNDGSEDNSLQLIQEFLPENAVIINQENKGVSTARNIGIKASKREYIAFLDADDQWHPKYLESVAYLLEKHPEAKIVGSRYTMNLSDLNYDFALPEYYQLRNYFKTAVHNILFFTSGVVIQRNFFTKNQFFKRNFRIGEDTDLWFRANFSKGKSFYIKNPLVYYHQPKDLVLEPRVDNLSNTLMGNSHLIYEEEIKNKNFSLALSAHNYLNTIHYLIEKDTHEEALNVFKNLQNRIFVVEIPLRAAYYLPEILMSNDSKKIWLRKYTKFILRNFYGRGADKEVLK